VPHYPIDPDADDVVRRKDAAERHRPVRGRALDLPRIIRSRFRLRATAADRLQSHLSPLPEGLAAGRIHEADAVREALSRSASASVRCPASTAISRDRES